MNRALWMPKKPRWAIAFEVAALLALLVALAATRTHALHPARGAGLAFGIAAATLYALEALYPVRRKLLAKPYGSAQRWIQLHIWGGLLTCFLVLLHSGFRAPSGTLGWLMFVLTLWVTLTGGLGAFLQKYYPVLLTRNLTVEALFERIPELVARLPNEGDQLIAGASDVLQGFYRSDVRPALLGLAPSWGYLGDVRGGREKRLLPFARMTQFVSVEERGKLDDLKTIFVEKLELDAQYSIQRALRSWTLLHVPPAAILLGLIVIHIASAILY